MEFPNSIITQVATQQEHKSYSTTHIDKKSSNGSVKQKKRKDSSSHQRSSGLQSLLCCLRRPSRRRRNSDKKRHRHHGNDDDDDDDDDDDRRTAANNNNSQLANEGNGGSEGGERSVVGRNGGGDMRYLLPPLQTEHEGKKCAVIDLDETLVHSSFKPISNADFIVPVEIDGTTHEVYVLKRPHVDTYLERMGEMFECVLFTASLAKYADPVADLLDKSGVFAWRLFRESCVFHHGNYVKDLNLIGRQLNKTIIIDNSPVSYSFHPNNAVPVISWFDDPHDTELLDILPFLEAIAESEDVYTVLTNHGFTSHAVRNTDFLKQQQQLNHHLRHDDDDDDDENDDVITSVRQDR